MFNKKMLAASMAAAITTGGMVAQTHAIGVTNNSVGQVLLAPIYFVENGYTTDITVTNTRTDAAVKAKVVFRSHVKSTEILDFVIYLTPGDVWRGQVVTGSTGRGHIQSSDDSMRNATDTGWADTTAVDQAFFGDALSTGDSTTFGHFEVIGAYAAAGNYPNAGASGVTIEQGMSKDNLKLVFDAADGGTIGRQNDYTDCGPATLNDTNIDADGTVSSISPCALQIMGDVRIGSATDPNRASMRMTALGTNGKGSMYRAAANTEAAAETAGYVITSPNFNVTTAAESLIGVDFGVTGGACASDNITCIEMALAGEQTSYEYEASSTEATHTAMVFPTKYRHASAVNTCGGASTATTGEYTPPFQPTSIGEMNYSYTSLNNSELGATAAGSSFSGSPDAVASSFSDEVNYHFTMSNFAESGWAYYTWTPMAGCPYSGAPVIGYTYKFRPSTTSTETMLQVAPNGTFVD